MAKSPIKVSVVWLAGDWPADEPVPCGQRAFNLVGKNAPEIRCAQFTLGTAEPVHDFLRRELNKVALARWDAGAVGVSIFGRRLRRGQRLFDGDRIELLGPIVADPKSKRRAQVKQERQQADRTVWTRK